MGATWAAVIAANIAAIGAVVHTESALVQAVSNLNIKSKRTRGLDVASMQDFSLLCYSNNKLFTRVE